MTSRPTPHEAARAEHPAGLRQRRAGVSHQHVAAPHSTPSTESVSSISGPFELIAFFDCWHDTADPLGVATAARTALADGGSVLAVEPFANDRLEDNATPLGRFGYGISTLVCTPCSISDGGPGLGAQAGEARTRNLFQQAGFSSFRRAAETPLNVIYEARV